MSDSKKKRPVTLIEDPFGFNTLEISEAQSSEDELELDEITEDVDAENDANPKEIPVDLAAPVSEADLERLAQAMSQVEAEVAESEVAAVPEFSPEEELAAQIEEDKRLQQELKAEEAAAREAAGPSPLLGPSGELDLNEVQSCVEAILFISDKPMSAKRLRELLGPEHETGVFEQAIARVQEEYSSTRHGFELVEVNGGFQFRTKPGRAELAKKLVRVQVQRLSSGAMETLALVAYKQPAMKEDIDKVRGVDSSYFVRGLLDRKLIKITGRSELPGRPMLYSTTDEFLELFGLADLSALPPLHEIEKMVPASESQRPEDEDPRVREMRRLVAEMKAGTESRLSYDPKEDARILQEIRERVSAIPSSTPYLEEQKAKEKQAKIEAEGGAVVQITEVETTMLSIVQESTAEAVDTAETAAPEAPTIDLASLPETLAETPPADATS